MKSLKLAIVGLLLASTNAFAGAGEIGSANKDQTGDTIGAALTQLTGIQRGLDFVFDPERNLGKIGFFDGDKLAKAVCSSVGSAEGGAFAIQTNLRLYTPGFFSEGGRDIQLINQQVLLLINVLSDISNDYCMGNSTDLNKVKKDVYRARNLSNALYENLTKYRDSLR